MSEELERDYNQKKSLYHRLGEKLKGTKGRGRNEAKKEYEDAKRDYRRSGIRLRASRTPKRPSQKRK